MQKQASLVLAGRSILRIFCHSILCFRLSGKARWQLRAGLMTSALKKCVRHLHHHSTATAVAAERAFLRYLEGGCQIPIGAYGQIIGNELQLEGVVGSTDGKRIVRGKKIGAIANAEQIGVELAIELLNRGAKEILEEIRQTT